ncbi:Arginine decarboxylase [Bienertia sinuspersici]
MSPAAAAIPPRFAAVNHLSLPLSGVLPSTNSITTTTTTTANNGSTDWSSSMSSSLYRIDRWGPPYFNVNSSGNVIIRPFGDATLPHQEIDLLKVVKKVSDSKSNGGLGLQFPLIVRFPDVLKHRLESLQLAFDYAVQSSGYGSHYQGVYPVKCNQDRFVVEDIVKFGSGFRFGLEAGSKPELLLAMSSLCKGHPDAFLVCNGFKDAEYISLAIIARKLALNTVIVLEQEEEVDLVIELSQLLRTRPAVGVRAKLRTKHAGHFGSTSGEKGKFGLTTGQILRVVRKLDAVGMLDCLQLLHFHIGSQIPSTTLLSDGVAEGAQVYCELARLGACMRVIDIGGGLGIDYDGSKSTESDISVGYTLDEYASAVVRAVQVVCDRKGMKHPVICSESGRAIVSHHSILVFEAVSATGASAAPPVMSQLDLEYLAEELTGEAREEFDKMYASAMRQEYEGCLVYAEQMKQHCIDQFKDGCLGMEQLAAVDGLCEMVSKALGVGETVSTYHVNLDGKIDKFIGGESSLPLHEIRGDNGSNGGAGVGGGGYYLGMFLGGAYEEALGGVHNLFGGPSVVRVLQSDGPHSFAVTRAVPGPSSGDVLRVMQHEPELMFQALKHRAEECLNPDNNHNNDDTASLADGLARSFNNMPYLVAGPTATTCGFINNVNENNAYHHPYFCGAEDTCCNGNAVEVAKAEDEQWSYVCA